MKVNDLGIGDFFYIVRPCLKEIKDYRVCEVRRSESWPEVTVAILEDSHMLSSIIDDIVEDDKKVTVMMYSNETLPLTQSDGTHYSTSLDEAEKYLTEARIKKDREKYAPILYGINEFRKYLYTQGLDYHEAWDIVLNLINEYATNSKKAKI
jgi:hypothetical protein